MLEYRYHTGSLGRLDMRELSIYNWSSLHWHLSKIHDGRNGMSIVEQHQQCVKKPGPLNAKGGANHVTNLSATATNKKQAYLVPVVKRPVARGAGADALTLHLFFSFRT